MPLFTSWDLSYLPIVDPLPAPFAPFDTLPSMPQSFFPSLPPLSSPLSLFLYSFLFPLPSRFFFSVKNPNPSLPLSPCIRHRNATDLTTRRPLILLESFCPCVLAFRSFSRSRFTFLRTGTTLSDSMWKATDPLLPFHRTYFFP